MSVDMLLEPLICIVYDKLFEAVSLKSGNGTVKLEKKGIAYAV